MPDTGNFPQARVVVLGANGFVGRRLVEALAREHGMRPVAAARSRGMRADVESVICDSTDRPAMKRALTGADYAVNCVAGNPATMIAATKLLCDIARRSGLRRLVHLSSMAVYGGATGLVHEASPAVGPLTGYGEAKRTCERLVREFIADGGEAVILRPGSVYGPGSEQWTGRIARLLRAGRLGDLGADGDGVCNLTFIDDLVAAILASLLREQAAGEAFNVASADPPDWNSYLTRFARALGATPVKRLSGRRLKLETKLAAPALRLASMGAKATRVPVRVPDAITPSLARLFRQDIRLDVHKAVELLRLRETGLDWGIAASARWIGGERWGTSGQQRDALVEVQQR